MFGRKKAKLTFDVFETSLRRDMSSRPSAPWTAADTEAVFGLKSELLTEFLSSRAHESYNAGLIRFGVPGGRFDPRPWNGPDGWRADWVQAVGLAGVGYDWLGRIYGVDGQGRWGKRGCVARLVPGTGEVEGSDIGVEDFFFGQTKDELDEAFSGEYFRDWCAATGVVRLSPEECVGYRVPLQLGGEDDVPNLEVLPATVYWSLAGQLTGSSLTPGANVDRVRL